MVSFVVNIEAAGHIRAITFTEIASRAIFRLCSYDSSCGLQNISYMQLKKSCGIAQPSPSIESINLCTLLDFSITEFRRFIQIIDSRELFEFLSLLLELILYAPRFDFIIVSPWNYCFILIIMYYGLHNDRIAQLDKKVVKRIK